MRAYVAPSTFFEAAARYQQTVKNIDRIDRQLDDVQRQLVFPSKKEYHIWRHNAATAREHIHEDRDLLLKWMEEHDPILMRRMFHLMMDFIGDGEDLIEEERTLIRDLQAYFDTLAKMAS